VTLDTDDTQPRILLGHPDRVIGASGWIPPWLLELVKLHGKHEIPGLVDDPWIDAAFALCGLPRASDDKDPWCSAGLCKAFEDAGVRSPRSAAARHWLKYGIPLAEPVFGAVLVWDRHDAKNPNAAHVNVCVADLGKRLAGYGCNQHNMIDIDTRPRGTLLGVRWTDDPRYPPPAPV